MSHYDPKIDALITAVAVLFENGETVNLSVMEKIGRYECERTGLDPNRMMNQSGVPGGSSSPQWEISAQAAISRVRYKRREARGVLNPEDIHTRLEALERAVFPFPPNAIAGG